MQNKWNIKLVLDHYIDWFFQEIKKNYLKPDFEGSMTSNLLISLLPIGKN